MNSKHWLEPVRRPVFQLPLVEVFSENNYVEALYVLIVEHMRREGLEVALLVRSDIYFEADHQAHGN